MLLKFRFKGSIIVVNYPINSYVMSLLVFLITLFLLHIASFVLSKLSNHTLKYLKTIKNLVKFSKSKNYHLKSYQKKPLELRGGKIRLRRIWQCFEHDKVYELIDVSTIIRLRKMLGNNKDQLLIVTPPLVIFSALSERKMLYQFLNFDLEILMVRLGIKIAPTLIGSIAVFILTKMKRLKKTKYLIGLISILVTGYLAPTVNCPDYIRSVPFIGLTPESVGLLEKIDNRPFVFVTKDPKIELWNTKSTECYPMDEFQTLRSLDDPNYQSTALSLRGSTDLAVKDQPHNSQPHNSQSKNLEKNLEKEIICKHKFGKLSKRTKTLNDLKRDDDTLNRQISKDAIQKYYSSKDKYDQQNKQRIPLYDSDEL